MKYINIMLFAIYISGNCLAIQFVGIDEIQDQLHLVNAILENGFQAGIPADRKLWDACVESNLEKAHQAIAEGANVNFRIGNETPLELAANFIITVHNDKSDQLPSPKLVRLLLAHGADPLVQFSAGVNEWTILSNAKFYLRLYQEFDQRNKQLILAMQEIIQILEEAEARGRELEANKYGEGNLIFAVM